ncbi:MAG: TadE/TadG family type IV pilus assembly protein [Acidimicrobiia bacterium]
MPAYESRSANRSRSDRGASLVEFALVAPLLLLLLIGVVEFGWLFAQNLDVRHGAREGARLAAVNFPEGPEPNSGVRGDPNRDALVAEICSRMQTPTGADVTIASSGSVGDAATVTVSTPGQTLTGFIDFLLPSPLDLDSTVQIRLEQAATWTDTVGAQLCP